MENLLEDLTFSIPPAPAELIELLNAPITAEDDGTGHLLGTVVTASVVEVDEQDVYVRFAEDQLGRCPVTDAAAPGDRSRPAIGDTVSALVEEDLEDGRWRVSIGKAALLAKLEAIRAQVGTGQRVTGRINVVMKGGFAAEVAGLRAYVPGRESGIPQARAFDAIGQEFEFTVLELEEDDAQPVLSRTSIVQEEKKVLRSARLAEFAEGQIVSGTVASIRPFGAFIDIGGVDALCHISELSLQHLDQPDDAVRVGDTVTVKIIEIKPESGKIAVSRRELLATEQRGRIAELGLGEVMDGTVTRLTDFGAFIALQDNIEGLCHVSELSWTQRPRTPAEVLEVGQKVQVRVLEVNPDNGKIALSLRAVAPNPWASLETDSPSGSAVRGVITRIEDYGLFVRLPQGVEGLCHISDLAWEGRPRTPTDVRPFVVGEEIDVKVLSMDAGRGRVSLGIKQLTADPWEDNREKLQAGAIFEATVSRFDDNAAYLQIAPGLEGRMHISEISTERVESLRAALRIGQTVEVMCKAADPARRRIDLSMKAVAEKLEADMPKSFSDDTRGLNSALADALSRRTTSGDS